MKKFPWFKHKKKVFPSQEWSNPIIKKKESIRAILKKKRRKKEFRENTNRIPFWKFKLNNLRHQTRRKKHKIKIKITPKDLDKQWLKQKGKCYYTGIELEPSSSRSPSLTSISIDRINNNKHYEKGNIRFVGQTINSAKQDLSHDEFLNLFKKILLRFNKIKNG